MIRSFAFTLFVLSVYLNCTGQNAVIELTGNAAQNTSFWKFNCYDYISGIKRKNADERQVDNNIVHLTNIKAERYYLGGISFIVEPNDTAILNINKYQSGVNCDVKQSKYPGNYLWPFQAQIITESYSKAYAENKIDLPKLIKTVNEIFKNSEKKLNEMALVHEFSSVAYQIYFAELKFIYYNSITSIYLENENEKDTVLQTIVSKFDLGSFDNDSLVEISPFFTQALSRYFSTITVSKKNASYLDSVFFKQQFQKALSFKSIRVRDFLLGQLLQYYYFMKCNMNDNVVTIEDIKNNIINLLNNTKILIQFFEYEKESENYKFDQAVAKKIILVDPTDQKRTLWDIIKSGSGHILYFDFWATWCGPCLNEIPYLDFMKHRFEDTLSIITISLDLNIEKWKKYVYSVSSKVKKYCVQDSTSEKSLRQLFDINAIPRSILIDKKGNVGAKQALSPSTQKGVIIQIENLIKRE